MKVITSYYTDVGKVKTTNQDSMAVEIVNSPKGRIVFAMVCDGMGGLEQGELVSKEVVLSFKQWFDKEFVAMVADDSVTEHSICEEWKKTICSVNQKLMNYGTKHGKQIGTTLTMLLICQEDFYLCHVGDSRVYRVTKELAILTQDHTVVGNELRMGRITRKQAEHDPRRNMLLQCVGASAFIQPQMMKGRVTEETTFILCSDGFVHCLSSEEIYHKFRPEALQNKEDVAKACRSLSRLVMERGERDNITVIGIVLKNVGSNGF